MRLSFNLLKNLVKIPDDLSPFKVASELKLRTVEVEEVIDLSVGLEGVVLGEVVTLEKHPNADQLQVCRVKAGTDEYNVVCGGNNLKLGMKVAFGKVGAKVRWHGEGELVELKPAKIRSVESFGMICASDEIGLGEMFPKKSEKEIFDLSHLQISSGTPLAEALGLNDFIFEIDNKSLSHRPDLFGHLGLAREVAAIFDLELISLEKIIEPEIKSGLEIDIKDQSVESYYGALIEGVNGELESPVWLKNYLLSLGVRPISALVDITNFVMFEVGSPLHAFDALSISPKFDGKLIVRKAQDLEKFVALDGKTYILNAEDSVIAGQDGVAALAGVMGGMSSGVSAQTTQIILEAAVFNARQVRRTSGRLGLRSESSTRFEKGLDPETSQLGFLRALHLLKMIFPSASIKSYAPAKVADKRQKNLDFSFQFLRSFAGVDVSKDRALNILTKLGFLISEKSEDVISVSVPSYRLPKDVLAKEDLAEEILRIYGFEKIDSSLPVLNGQRADIDEVRNFARQAASFFPVHFSAFETATYSFASLAEVERFGFLPKDLLELENPIASDRPFLRPLILPTLLSAIENQLHGQDRLSVFESGRVFVKNSENYDDGGKTGKLPNQPYHLAAILVLGKDKNPFIELSSELRFYLSGLGFGLELREFADAPNFVHIGRSAEVFVGDIRVGMIFELSPLVAKKISDSQRLAMFEISLDDLARAHKKVFEYKSVPALPAVDRDLSFVVDENFLQIEILNCLKTRPLVETVELVSVYRGKGLEEKEKSLSYRLTLSSPEQLDAKALDAWQSETIDFVTKKFPARLR